MDFPETIAAEIAKCVHCGSCRSVCPVFAAIQREAASARGKITLAETSFEGKLPYSKKFKAAVEQCLLCKACVENCANEVRTDNIVIAARTAIARDKGLSFTKKLLFQYFLDSDKLMPSLMKAGSLFQALALRKIPEQSGLHRRFPLPYFDQRRTVPKLAKKPFLEQYPEYVSAEKEKLKVGFFTGCLINYIYPGVGEALINLLGKQGVSVVIPREQKCCGLPALGSGDLETTRSLALDNITAFEDSGVDYIVTACGSCGSTLKEYYRTLLEAEPPEIQHKAESFRRKIIDISDFLVNVVKFPQAGTTDGRESAVSNLKVTYHDPCHLRRGMKVYREPRELIKSIPGTEFIEMPSADRCCGFGGGFNLSYYELSLDVLKKKIGDLKETGADYIATSCPGCILQLRDGINQEGLKTKAVHLVELLNALYFLAASD
ncbi:MAG: (Fe-S)-binding protein [Deltaproteobacteria bacterium]|nr:MAG: (Fe-S)-binding protein [Deltaproteobacteria bacterium]